tara:strand:- start:1345 stop:1731 length:387 start_codon:yes stop_codon:yes gene_type:complete
MTINSLEELLSFLQTDLIYLMQENRVIFIICLLLLIVLFWLIFRSIKNKKKLNVSESQTTSMVKKSIDIGGNTEFNLNTDKNDFIDVLTAIEEEMAAVRELYVNGYITKGIYISETDKLYEKAKIFGL